MDTLRGMKNGGKRHLFLGNPVSNGLDKTVVEPGNAFSPGLWTLGISLAVKSGSEIIAPETRDLPLAFEDDLPPVTVSEYRAGGAEVKSRLAHLGGKGWQGVDYFAAEVSGAYEDAALVIRDIGPAGGKIDGIGFDADSNTLKVKGGPSLVFETPVRAEVLPADEKFDSPCAIVHFAGSLKVKVLHSYAGREFCNTEHTDEARMHYTVDEGFVKAKEEWRQALPARVYAPDPRVEKTWQQTAFNMMSAMEHSMPRISVNNYPIFWIRDCVIVLRALDLMGRGDLVDEGCEYLAPIVFSGGFGAESDNPGEGLWILSEHALLKNDAAWTEKLIPYLRDRADWIRRMSEAEETIYRAADMRTVWAHYWPGSDIVCLKHRGNHIHGRMDGHSPDYYINVWAVSGLRSALRLAEKFGKTELIREWKPLEEKLAKAVYEELQQDYGNERDLCVSPYPAGIVGDAEKLREDFVRIYDRLRLTETGERKAEPLWTYFEAAQIHNAFLLGERDRAWTNLNGMLNDGFGMSIYTEGEWGHTEMLPFGTGAFGRGWLQEGAPGANMPHNWTSGEMALLLRDMFVCEEENGLVLLAGVPGEWLKPGAKMGVSGLPTAFGTVSFEAAVNENGKVTVTFSEGADIPYRISAEEVGKR